MFQDERSSIDVLLGTGLAPILIWMRRPLAPLLRITFVRGTVSQRKQLWEAELKLRTAKQVRRAEIALACLVLAVRAHEVANNSDLRKTLPFLRSTRATRLQRVGHTV